MAAITPKALIGALDPTCRRLEAALGLCVARTHFHTEIEHWLLALLDAKNADLPKVLSSAGADPGQVRRELELVLDGFKTGNGRTPDIAPDLFDLVRESWVLASLGLGAPAVHSGHVLAALVTDRALGPRIKLAVPELGKINAETLGSTLAAVLGQIDSDENAPTAGPLTSGRTTRFSLARPASGRRPSWRGWPSASSPATCPTRSSRWCCGRSTWGCCRPGAG